MFHDTIDTCIFVADCVALAYSVPARTVKSEILTSLPDDIDARPTAVTGPDPITAVSVMFESP